MKNNWLDQPQYANVKSEKKQTLIPKGSWKLCPNCNEKILTSELINNMYVCPVCDFHFNMPFLKRLNMIVDANSFQELFSKYPVKDPLKFLDFKLGTYVKKINDFKRKTKVNESVIVGSAKINKINFYLGIMIFDFIGGSMGIVCGDKIYQIMLVAIKKKSPLILICSSGGARMQEGLLSLMQMAKTSGGVELMKKKKIPFLVVLTNPTYGGVSASFASLGDIIIAEKNAQFGFAGKRVIESTVKQKLPPDFQTAEFLMDKGFIDIIVHRRELKKLLFDLLNIIENKK